MLKGRVLAIFLPVWQPRVIAAVLVRREKIITNHGFIPIRAAPMPTAIPSRDRAKANKAASFIEICFEASVSAISGFFRMAFLMVSEPITKRMVKANMVAKIVGMIEDRADPARIAKAVMEVHINVITQVDLNGIFMFLLP